MTKGNYKNAYKYCPHLVRILFTAFFKVSHLIGPNIF